MQEETQETNHNNIELKTEPIPKLLIKYCLPATIGMIVNALYNVVDRIFIGNIPNVGSIAMVGLGVTLPMVSILNAFGMLLAVGGATSISLKEGEGDKSKSEYILANVLALAGIIGITITIIGLTFSDQILTLFGGSPESLPYAKAYINIILLGCTFSIYGGTFSYLIRGDGNPKLSAKMMILGCLLNIFLDAVFIFGFSLGIQGAALATIISQFTTTMIGVSYYITKKSKIRFHFANVNLKLDYIKPVILIGLAPFCTQLASSCTQVVANNMLYTHGGNLAIAGYATLMSIMMMIGMPLVGLTTGMQPIVSYNYGAKEYNRVEEVLKIAVTTLTIFLIFVWILITVFPEPIVRIFNNDEELLALTIDGMKKYLLFFPLLGITFVGNNFIQSTGQAKLALTLSLLRQVIFLIPLVSILPHFLGLDGVWYSQPIADILSCVVTSTAVMRTIHNYRKEMKNDVVNQ